jgi:hypothetical protein
MGDNGTLPGEGASREKHDRIAWQRQGLTMHSAFHSKQL